MKTITLNKTEFSIGWVIDPHLSDRAPRSRTDDYMSAIMNKMDQVMSENDVTIFLGDIGNKPVFPTALSVMLAQLFIKHKLAGKKLYFIPGNHDIFNLNVDTLKKTFLGLLAEIRVVDMIDDSIMLNGLYIKAMHLQHSPEIPTPEAVPEGTIKILLGHYFYESALDTTYSVTADQVKNCGYDYLILGHDHEEHDPLTIGKTVIYRFGALARNTSHKYNLDRTPKYLKFEIKGGRIFKTLVPLKHMAAIAVFEESAFVKTPVNKYSALTSLNQLMEAFKKTTTDRTSKPVGEILKGMSAPNGVVIYLKTLYEKHHLSF